MEPNYTLADVLSAASTEDNKYKAAENLRLTLELEVNRFGFRPDEINRKATSEPGNANFFKRLAIRWIEYWANNGASYVDGRNEMAVERCRHIYAMPEYRSELEKLGTMDGSTVEGLFIRSTPRIHRTLMQSLTTVMTYALCAAFPRIEAARDFQHSLPMI